MDAAQNLIQPGKDHKDHEQKLQGEIAQALGVPPEQITPIDAQSPLKQERSDALAELEEKFNAWVPGTAKTQRVAPAKDFLKELWRRLRRQHPGDELKEAA